MSDLYRRAGSLAERGASCVVTPATAPWEFTGLTVLEFDAGEKRQLSFAGFETAVLPLTTGCTLSVDGHRFDLTGRSTVFGEITDWAYVPVGADAQIAATAAGEIALCTARASRRIQPYYVPSDEVAIEVRGGGVGTRQINNFLSAGVHDADKLIAVEVITPEGNWSSYPPHKHDEFSDVEVPLEEIYYFKIDGDGGIGMFNLYTTDGEISVTEVVRDGDVVLVPRGYHGPAGAPPGHHMYYLNVMAGPSEERTWKFTDDPVHARARAALDALSPDPRLPLEI